MILFMNSVGSDFVDGCLLLFANIVNKKHQEIFVHADVFCRVFYQQNWIQRLIRFNNSMA